MGCRAVGTPGNAVADVHGTKRLISRLLDGRLLGLNRCTDRKDATAAWCYGDQAPVVFDLEHGARIPEGLGVPEWPVTWCHQDDVAVVALVLEPCVWVPLGVSGTCGLFRWAGEQ